MRYRVGYIFTFFMIFLLFTCIVKSNGQAKNGLQINDQEYFEMPGLNVMVFHDYYPIGHQSGVTIIQNGSRVAANGDIMLLNYRRPFPEHDKRKIDVAKNQISINVGYPDSMQNMQRDLRYVFPDIVMMSTVRVRGEGNIIHISVDLEKPLPADWAGKVMFGMELFPGHLFGKTYYMDDVPGLFPRQANSPVIKGENGVIGTKPMATGKKLIVLPESKDEMISFESLGEDLQLMDGRIQAKNGWFVLQSPLKGGTTKNAAQWVITAAVDPEYVYKPVIQVSQVGYMQKEAKVAVIELDKRVSDPGNIEILRISPDGEYAVVKSGKPAIWGKFLRYNYAKFDFSDIQQSGMYTVKYDDSYSDPFMIDNRVYDRNVWQPTLEYYLPVQMCHMRVNDGVKVWHGLCHDDDALMAPVNHIHFDGYKQGPSTLTKYKPYEPVPGLDVGGWHDAGDFDLRVESQAGTSKILAYTWELFKPSIDETSVDQKNKVVEMHVPDGIPDVLQQIEQGALTVVAGYKALGRLYRGIICSTGRQYSLLGDATNMTDNLIYDPSLKSGDRTQEHSGIMDDRWVFTEENPRREAQIATDLAVIYRSLKGYNDDLANECLDIAKKLYESVLNSNQPGLISVASELYLSTHDEKYLKFIVSSKDLVVKYIRFTGPAVARVADNITDKEFMKDIKTALTTYASSVKEVMNRTPYGVNYTPNVWGDGWNIQRFGVNQYFLHKGFPDIFPADPVFNALNFVLGVHPGKNNSSFVSGVGAKSITVAYGYNRDEWSYIPGGSVSGTAIIRPDLPELRVWPYFWQQTEYVMGGGATNYMFLVLAVKDMMDNSK